MMYGTNIQTDETWKRIPEGSIGAEIGVWKGESSEKFLRRASKLYLIDPWSPVAYEDSDEFGDFPTYLRRYSKLVGGTSPADFQKFYDQIYEQVYNKFNDSCSVVIHRGTSASFFETFTELKGKLDWIYIDGSHSYDLVYDDLCSSYQFIKRGGSIFGDDYSDKKPGVKGAVDDFILMMRASGVALPLEVFGPNHPRWPNNQFEIKV